MSTTGVVILGLTKGKLTALPISDCGLELRLMSSRDLEGFLQTCLNLNCGRGKLVGISWGPSCPYYKPTTDTYTLTMALFLFVVN